MTPTPEGQKWQVPPPINAVHYPGGSIEYFSAAQMQHAYNQGSTDAEANMERWHEWWCEEKERADKLTALLTPLRETLRDAFDAKFLIRQVDALDDKLINAIASINEVLK